MTRLHGCHNRPPMKCGYWAQNGVISLFVRLLVRLRILVRRAVWVPHRMSRDCKHDKRATDPGCTGCRWIAERDQS